jgi:hypothetical protein
MPAFIVNLFVQWKPIYVRGVTAIEHVVLLGKKEIQNNTL